MYTIALIFAWLIAISCGIMVVGTNSRLRTDAEQIADDEEQMAYLREWAREKNRS
jgi:hypothetical protein